MKTSHINHVVLYAKNFYRHTGDIIKDMQRFTQLDGHKFWEVKTPDKLLKVMRADYLKWAESLDDDDENKKDMLNEVDDVVAWEKGVAAHIWYYIIIYQNHIPMSSKYLSAPAYDQYHMPQFSLTNPIFNKSQSYEEMIAAAKKVLDQTHEDRYDEYMNILMDKYPFEELAEVFTNVGDHVTKEDLETELWDEYTKFMDENVLENGEMVSDYFNRYTKHFDISFNTKNYGVDIHVEAIFNTITVELPGEFNDKTIHDLLRIASGNSEFIEKRIEITNVINKVFEGYSLNVIDDEYNEYSHIVDSIEEIESSFDNEYIKERLLENKTSGISTGYFNFLVKINENSTTLTINFEDIFECSIMEDELRNFVSSFISGEKY